MKLFVAGKVFIRHNNAVLILRESTNYKEGTNAGKFDVVGGRLQPGEKLYESIMREVSEETGLSVKLGKPFFVNESMPVVKGEQWHVVRVFFSGITESDAVVLNDEHDEYEWINPADYGNYPIIENLNPAFEEYLKLR